MTSLTDREVSECSFQEARLIVNGLQKKMGTTTEGVNAVEMVEGWLHFSIILHSRFLNGEFNEEVEKNGVSDADLSIFEHHLVALISEFSYMFQVVDLKRDIQQYQRENEQLAWKLKSFIESSEKSNKQMRAEEKELRGFLEELASQVETTTNYMEDAEHTILTHVLTLVGVFSAIITVILSMATTSSTWLNNADAADALLAFVIPNLVTVLAVIVLVALVFIYHGSKTTRYVKRKDADEKVVFEKIKTGREGLVPKFGALFVVVLLLCFGIATYSFIKTYEPVHTRYVVTPLDYEVCVECDSETGQEYEAYRFMIENKEQTFLCSDEYLHNGNLHYCSVHGELE